MQKHYIYLIIYYFFSTASLQQQNLPPSFPLGQPLNSKLGGRVGKSLNFLAKVSL